MRNIWVICRRELRSYFVSPVAYVLFVMFALIFGWFFWNMLGAFVFYSMASQMRGEMTPMNVNEQILRQLLGNMNVVGLFFIPVITMRLFAEEKRNGTIELLATSPIQDFEVILGKWLAAVALYAGMLLLTGLNLGFVFKYGNPDWKPMAVGYLGLLLQASALLAIGTIVMHLAVLEPDLPRGTVIGSFSVIAYMYGLLVGAILLAGEQAPTRQQARTPVAAA